MIKKNLLGIRAKNREIAVLKYFHKKQGKLPLSEVALKIREVSNFTDIPIDILCVVFEDLAYCGYVQLLFTKTYEMKIKLTAKGMEVLDSLLDIENPNKE